MSVTQSEGLIPPRYLNVPDAARYISRTEKALRRLVERRMVPHLRIGRRVQFDREALDSWMGRHARRGMTVQ